MLRSYHKRMSSITIFALGQLLFVCGMNPNLYCKKQEANPMAPQVVRVYLEGGVEG